MNYFMREILKLNASHLSEPISVCGTRGHLFQAFLKVEVYDHPEECY